ncbi:unnamed protein product [Toxocara canis]|uniref:SSD domain-containing protein n=1 Tax=Toxocara canis TaxID=6265 RepID=A0A183V3E1_TOXCA|nr:unnamed protein product [Toxocara canis]
MENKKRNAAGTDMICLLFGDRPLRAEVSVVARWPLAFAIIPPIATIVMAYIAIQTAGMTFVTVSLEMFQPDYLESIRNLKELMDLFTPLNTDKDSYEFENSSFASFIFEDISETANVLRPVIIQKIASIHRTIIRIKTNKYTFDDVCMKINSTFKCNRHPVMLALESDDSTLALRLLMRYPSIRALNVDIDNTVIFGGVNTDEHSNDHAGDTFITSARSIRLIYLLDDSIAAKQWTSAFISTVSQMRFPHANIFFTSSGSQPGIALVALLNAFMAIIASISTLIYIGYPLICMVFLMPPVVISVEIDNTYLILNSWRMKTEGSADERITNVIGEISVPLLLTALTDEICYLIGSMSNFFVVKSACIEDCLRRRKFVSKLFTSNMTRVIVLFIYLFYICASLNSILRLQVGTDFKLFTPDDSYVSLEMHARQRLYPNYVGFCFAVVKTQNMQWGNTSKRRRLIALYNALGSTEYTSKAGFWMDEFENSITDGVMDEIMFLRKVHEFLERPQYRKFRNDIHFGKTGSITAVKLNLRVRSFPLVEQQIKTNHELTVNALIGYGMIMFLCLLIIPRPISVLCIAVSIVSINVGVVAILSACSIRLDIITMITLLISIGFSADFTMRITFHFLVHKSDRLQVNS